MSFISFENFEVLEKRYTDEISAFLASSRVTQQFEPLMLWTRQRETPMPFMLILQLGKSYINYLAFNDAVYHREAHMLGKAVRLLTYLEETDGLFNKLQQYSIKSIMVTNAPNASMITDANKWVLDVTVAHTTVRELLKMKRYNPAIFEAAIKTLVKENSRN